MRQRINIHTNPHKHWLFGVQISQNTTNQYKSRIEPERAETESGRETQNPNG